MPNIEDCKSCSFRSLYNEYSKETFFGVFASEVSTEIPHHLEDSAHDNYIVNHTQAELAKRWRARSELSFLVFDRIRQVEEVLTGIFKTDNDEFNYIFRDFVSEFLMDEVWIIYSEGVKVLEEVLLHREVIKRNEDWLTRRQKAKFNSNFRLFKRRPDYNNGWKWDAILSGLTQVDLSEFENDMIRVTFNEGFFFVRLYRIFANYEAQMQSYIRLFKVLHKPLIVKGSNEDVIANKVNELLTAQVHISQTGADITNGSGVTQTELQKDIPVLESSYHMIQTQLNDDLARLGLGGDDSTKAERITTGENFRSLQPNSSFQQTILLELNKVAKQLSEQGVQLKFELAMQPNEQGIPVEQGKREIPEYAKDN